MLTPTSAWVALLAGLQLTGAAGLNIHHSLTQGVHSPRQPVPGVRSGSALHATAESGSVSSGASDSSSGYVLVTGGAGYIGSHTCLEMLRAGERVVVVDNMINSDEEALVRVRRLAAREDENALVFRAVDICDREALARVFEEFTFNACIHFAGLKAVGESVAEPLSYYENNIGGTTTLLSLLRAHGVKKLVFSSSATVYGDPEELPIRESAALSATNPYGKTKLYIEEILRDLAASDPEWRILILRYFNPIGAHESGEIGEDPQGIPNNLMPFIAQVCVGRRDVLAVFGDDYNTPDGTGVRDYIHVVDLALGHLSALNKLRQPSHDEPCVAVNLGTGEGVSVLDLVKGMEAAVGKPIPYKIAPRRPGDIAACYCDPAFAESFLGWKATRRAGDMCTDTWRWQSKNPMGYRTTNDS